MAQNISLLGADYPDVPMVVLPKTGGGSAPFTDISDTTAVASDVIIGKEFYLADGTKSVGTFNMLPMTPIEFDWNIGYINQNVWKYENPTNTYTDIYEVQAGHKYFITLGGNVGSRFRCIFTTVDIRPATSDVSGTAIISVNNPNKYHNASSTAQNDGYLLVSKDNVGKTGVISYVYDAPSVWL